MKNIFKIYTPSSFLNVVTTKIREMIKSSLPRVILHANYSACRHANFVARPSRMGSSYLDFFWSMLASCLMGWLLVESWAELERHMDLCVLDLYMDGKARCSSLKKLLRAK